MPRLGTQGPRRLVVILIWPSRYAAATSTGSWGTLGPQPVRDGTRARSRRALPWLGSWAASACSYRGGQTWWPGECIATPSICDDAVVRNRAETFPDVRQDGELAGRAEQSV